MIHEITRKKLAELGSLVGQLSNEQLSQPLEVLDGATLGMHIRHILEFYTCLFDALDQRVLNYDLRCRDSEMEVSSNRCTDCLGKILHALDLYEQDIPLLLKADYSGLTPGKDIHINTTYYRELLYNVEHCVHHLAILKIGMNSMDPALVKDKNMGVAASTQRNRNLCAQ